MLMGESEHAAAVTSPNGRGRIASIDAIRVRGYGLSIRFDPSPQPSPTRGEGVHFRRRDNEFSF
jgi:hypothetical protein